MKKIRANKIRFWLNDKLIETECLPSETALELIHKLGMQSVKEVCSEGDCGACTIAIGSYDATGFHYISVTACIYPATKLHGTHVMTTEGLGTPDDMHIIQSTLYENHASQCGFCTPGIVMSVFALFAENPEATLDEFKIALEGNLCRCTGYRHIVIAGEEMIESMQEIINSSEVILPDYAKAVQEDLLRHGLVGLPVCRPSIRLSTSTQDDSVDCHQAKTSTFAKATAGRKDDSVGSPSIQLTSSATQDDSVECPSIRLSTNTQDDSFISHQTKTSTSAKATADGKDDSVGSPSIHLSTSTQDDSYVEIEQIERDYYDHLPVDEYYMPTTLSDALKYLQTKPKLISGATDLFVEANIRREYKLRYLDITSIPEFKGIEKVNNEIRIGATVTLDEAAINPLIMDNFPALCEAVAIMSSQQIRNVATFAGNICNASPIADGTSALMGLSASVELMNPAGETRRVELRDFYLGYKKMEIKAYELLSAIYIPIKEYCYNGFIKTSKRKNVDISSVNSCMSIIFVGDVIDEITISYGGVKECTALALKTMEFLKGKTITKKLMDEALDVVAGEFKPISDVRGSDEYRSMLIRNHLKKHFLRMGGGE